jgi:hypothetical protein
LVAIGRGLVSLARISRRGYRMRGIATKQASMLNINMVRMSKLMEAAP